MQKKRTKKYTPKLPTIPALLQVQMTRDAHPELALKLHCGIVNLIEAPTVAACNQISFQLACIAGGMSHSINGNPLQGRKDTASIAIQSAIITIEGIIDRKERGAVLAVTEAEARTLRAAAGKLDDAMGIIPLPAYNRAVKEVQAVTGNI